MTRRRETCYPATISACVSETLRARLEALADQETVGLGIVIRLCLEAGLHQIACGGVGTRRAALFEARTWWESLDPEAQALWQAQLPALTDQELITLAWLRGTVE